VREDNDVLRQSFGTIADRYDRFRPGPPEEAVQRALPAGARDVLELGAGTGGLTRRLVRHCPHVRAVEPDGRMRAILLERVPEADVVAGSAEEIPAPDSSFDAVIGASMWHWVDEARALPEVARVLRPAGSFSLLWSGVDRSVDWVRSFWEGGKELNGAEKIGLDARRRARHQVHLEVAGPFLEPDRHVVRWTKAMTKDDLVAMAGTYSAVITMDAPERQEYLASISRFLETHDIPCHQGAIEVPMRCICWRTSLR
jgi:ubiquinone/menaquinone biosynthesis C-methylase UbiE